jgi:hypothetical protein
LLLHVNPAAEKIILCRRSLGMEPETSYYEQRAEAELDRAEQAHHPAAARAHYLLAGLYLDLIHGSGQSFEGNDADTAMLE